MLKGKPAVWYRLDVNVLAHLIFASLWNLSKIGGVYVCDLRNPRIGRSLVRDGESVRLFCFAHERRGPARNGKVKELMPQKSTYFYPKLASGLVFYQHK